MGIDDGSFSPPGVDGSISPLEPTQQRVVPEGERRTGPVDVEHARDAERAANEKLLDEMEASVDTQGPWFVKLGSKKPITETHQATKGRLWNKRTVDTEETVGYDDDRAFILKAQVANDVYGKPRTDFLVVTPDGILVRGFYSDEIENPDSNVARESKREYQALKNLVDGKIKPDASSQFYHDNWSAGISSIRDFNESGEERPLNTKIRFQPIGELAGSPTMEDFQKAVQESVAKTESPHKANVEVANQRARLATEAASMVRSLPPRE